LHELNVGGGLTVIFFEVIMEVTKEHILLYEFNKNNNATESAIFIYCFNIPHTFRCVVAFIELIKCAEYAPL